MSECSGAAVAGSVILEEPEASGASGARGEAQAQEQGPLRCAVWPRQQTWLCVVPLLIGFIGLGLSLMLLKWIVVGTVRDYVPTDLVDANRIGQDPIFLSKPSGIPKSPDTTTTTTTPTVDGGNPTPRTVTVAKGRTRSTATTTTTNPRGGGASGSQVTPRNPVRGRGPSGFTTTTAAPRTTFRIGAATSSPSPPNPTVLHDSTQMWTAEHTTTETVSTTHSTHTHSHRKTRESFASVLCHVSNFESIFIVWLDNCFFEICWLQQNGIPQVCYSSLAWLCGLLGVYLFPRLMFGSPLTYCFPVPGYRLCDTPVVLELQNSDP